MQEDKEKKQEFLRQNILEAGHDVEEFIEYLSSQQLGNDIEQIQFTDLKQIVQGYCKKKIEQSTSITKACKQLGFDSSTIQNEKQKQIKIIKFVVFGIIQQKYGVMEPEMTKTFKCKKIQSCDELQNPLKIEVNNYERKKIGGMFGLGGVSFWLFDVVTEKKKWKVKRRYTDFQWLRKMLLKHFPTYIIPPIPRKKASKKTVRQIQKRMRILTYFLNDLTKYPQIFYSKYVQAFMSVSNEKQFQKIKRQGQKAQSFQSIVSLQTSKGQVVVQITQQQKIFNQELSTFIVGAEPIYKQINRNAKIIQNNFLDQSNILFHIGNQFADLHTLLKTFNTKVPQFAQLSLNNTYIALNNMVIQWGNIVKSQFAFIQKNFLPFFRYIRNELFSFNELNLKVAQMQQQYFKTKISLDKKKQKLFDQNDVGKWKIPQHQLSTIPVTVTKDKEQAFKYMLPQQTSKVDILRLNYAFYASQYKIHALQLLQYKSKRFNQNFKQFAINIKVNSQQMSSIWTSVANNFAEPQRKLSVIRSVLEDNKQQQFQDDQ